MHGPPRRILFNGCVLKRNATPNVTNMIWKSHLESWFIIFSTAANSRYVLAFLKCITHFLSGSIKFYPLQWDESSKYMYRSIHIHATEEQLEKLHTLSKPDNIDGLLEEILSQSDFGMTQLIKEYTMDISSTIANHFSFNFDIPPRTKQISINFALLVIVYIICRRLRINFVVVIVFSVAYFLYEYLDYECHKVSCAHSMTLQAKS